MLEWIKPNFNKHQFIICMSESEKIAQEKSLYLQEISQINFYSRTVKVCSHRLCALLLFQIFITKVLENQ